MVINNLEFREYEDIEDYSYLQTKRELQEYEVRDCE